MSSFIPIIVGLLRRSWCWGEYRNGFSMTLHVSRECVYVYARCGSLVNFFRVNFRSHCRLFHVSCSQCARICCLSAHIRIYTNMDVVGENATHKHYFVNIDFILRARVYYNRLIYFCINLQHFFTNTHDYVISVHDIFGYVWLSLSFRK